ncbi:MAG: MBL fold metallo-hydrolase [Magnetococcales bacterium]|nr:MBL fold metallo-hydrolase [Magnetococcales bacterium]
MTAILSCVFLLSSTMVLANEPVWDANTIVLKSKKLADGVYAYYPTDAKEKSAQGIPIGTSGGFIVGEKSVLVIDTMLNQRLLEQVQKLVRSVTDTPIRYAINTSYHGDHSYGNMYLPVETTIIQHVQTKAYVDAHFKADTEFMIANFGKGRGIEEIVPRSGDILVNPGGRLHLDLGGKIVEVIDFGFAQTGGDLFIWEPESKVMWTGNAIAASKPALPWLLDGHLLETLTTFQKVFEFLPPDAHVVPGHGHVIGREDLRWHIDYLTAIKNGVKKAVNEGLTLEQTVERVTLPEFGGYALFGWVHPKLNVPAAYKDLTQPSQ